MSVRRFFSKTLTVIGAITVAIVIGGLIYCVILVRHGFSARDEPSSLEAAIARTLRHWSIPHLKRSLPNPIAATPAVLTKARAHWADHCASCHANNGSGETELGRNLYPRAPDMRLTETQKLTDAELFYIIENGVRLTGMPAWGEPGSDGTESWELVAFIRHLPQVTADEAREMEKLNPRSTHEDTESQSEADFLNQ